MAKKTSPSDLADVATCQRRVYLRARLGDRYTKKQGVARIRGQEMHARAFRQKRPDDASGDRRCFIASCVYGPDAWQTNKLRAYRDRVLERCWYGRAAVRVYYAISPPVARLSAASPAVGRLARRALDWFVGRLA